MEFIASYWWLWLLIFVGNLAYILRKAYKKSRAIKKQAMDFLDDNQDFQTAQSLSQMRAKTEKNQTSLLSLFKTAAISGIIAFISWWIFIISIVLNIIDYIKA